MKKAITFFILISLIFCFIPAQTFAFDDSEIVCGASILVDVETGTVLYEKNSDQKMSIASITKLMVILITMEEIKAGNLSLDTVITGTPEARSVGGSTMWLDTGEEFPLEVIIKAICIASANDAAVALAQHIGGTTEDFVARMNLRAKELGLKNTNYKNVMGFDDFEHYSTASDISVICRELLLKHPEVLEYSQIKEEWIRDGKTQLLNTNKLLGKYEYITGLKTGTETSAKYCFAATAKKDGRDVIAIVLGAESTQERFKQAEILLRHAYDNFDITTAVPAEKSVGKVKVLKGKEDFVHAVPINDLRVIIPKGRTDLVKQEIVLSENVTAPVVEGSEIGQITIRVDGEIVATSPLVAQKDVEKITFFGLILKLFQALFSF